MMTVRFFFVPSILVISIGHTYPDVLGAIGAHPDCAIIIYPHGDGSFFYNFSFSVTSSTLGVDCRSPIRLGGSEWCEEPVKGLSGFEYHRCIWMGAAIIFPIDFQHFKLLSSSVLILNFSNPDLSFIDVPGGDSHW